MTMRTMKRKLRQKTSSLSKCVIRSRYRSLLSVIILGLDGHSLLLQNLLLLERELSREVVQDRHLLLVARVMRVDAAGRQEVCHCDVSLLGITRSSSDRFFFGALCSLIASHIVS